MEDNLIDVMKKEGYHFAEGEEDAVSRDIDEAVKKNRFQFLSRDNKTIGFFIWDEVTTNGKLHLYITHMVVFNGQRNARNLLPLRKFFRDIYGGKISFAFWHNDRHSRFYYNKGEVVKNGRI